MPLEAAISEYEKLFNKPFESKVDKDKIRREFDELLKNAVNEEEILMEQETIETIIGSLKNGKSNGYYGISNEMVKYAMNKGNKRIATCYTILFNKIFESGTVSKNFNISIIKPIIKDNKMPSNKSNLRPVVVSDISDICFERAVAHVLRKQCKTNHRQFGFKKLSSCAHAIFVLIQSIKYAKQLNKKVYLCAIDASKAFDNKLNMLKTIILFTFILLF